MDFVPPVNAGFFPYQRTTRKAGDDAVEAEVPHSTVSGNESISLRPAAPIANMTMLYEILSRTGRPANAYKALRSMPRGQHPHRRSADGDQTQAESETQHAFDFIEEDL